MKEKPKIIIYLNNLLAFLGLYLFKIILPTAKKGNSLLFINTGQIGDIAISSIIFKNTKYLLSNYGAIYFLLREGYEDLIKAYPDINSIIINRKAFNLNPIYRFQLLKKIRNLGLKTCVNLTAARGVTNDSISILSGAEQIFALNSNFKYLHKLFGEYLDSLYTRIIAKDTTNEYKKHIKLLEFLGVREINEDDKLLIYEKQNNAHIENEIFKSDARIISIFPMSDMNIKNWPLKKYINLVQKLSSINGFKVVILGNKNQKRIYDSSRAFNFSNVINLSGKTSILECATIVRKSEVVIGNDSGFIHVAKAMNRKIVAIIGGGSYDLFIPYNIRKYERYLYDQMDCFGCEWRCHKKNPYCLWNVTVDEVFEKVCELIDENS